MMMMMALLLRMFRVSAPIGQRRRCAQRRFAAVGWTSRSRGGAMLRCGRSRRRAGVSHGCSLFFSVVCAELFHLVLCVCVWMISEDFSSTCSRFFLLVSMSQCTRAVGTFAHLHLHTTTLSLPPPMPPNYQRLTFSLIDLDWE